MKKLLCLLIALTSISIAFGQSRKYHRLKFLTHTASEVASYCNSSLPRKTFKINLILERKLEKGKVYKLKLEENLSRAAYYYIESSSSRSNQDADETYNVDVLSEAVNLCNSNPGTGGGVTPPSTPPTPSGEPKLTLDKNQTTVFSDCSSCSFVNDRHLLRGFISSFNISASIRNTGNAASNNTTLEFYGSRDTKLDSGDKNAFRDVTIPSLRPNNVGGGSVTISASDIIFDTFTPGNYNLLFVIDGKVIGSVPFRFSATASGFKTLSSLEEKNKPKQLKIFDLTGRIILEKTIESEDDEETVKNELKAGLYIIKSGNKSYKIYKN